MWDIIMQRFRLCSVFVRTFLSHNLTDLLRRHDVYTSVLLGDSRLKDPHHPTHDGSSVGKVWKIIHVDHIRHEVIVVK